MSGSIVIAGSVAQRANVGGHTWQFLQYLLGFRRLGFEVLFLDYLGQEMCLDSSGQHDLARHSECVRYLTDVMDRFGLGRDYALLQENGRSSYGLGRDEVLERVKRCDFLLNVMGFLTDEEILGAAGRRVFLDTDPGIGQMWHAMGWADIFRGHDDYVTIAENIGMSACPIPQCDLPWIRWHQPVVLEHWPRCESGRGAFTSIATWRGVYAPIEFEGRTYGQRVHEFRKFVAIPKLTNGEFELALDIDPADAKDLQLLRDNGWKLSDPRRVAADPWSYRDFIQQSGAEFSVSKGIVVETQCGWFSDRSVCYLASGKPVIVHDTGLEHLYTTGEGLITFSTVDEAVAGVQAVAADYEKHAKAAREIAEEYFDSDKVLRQLLSKLNIG